MDIELIKRLEHFYIYATEGLYISEIIEKDGYYLTISEYIKENWDNAANSLQVKDKGHFSNMWQEIRGEIIKRNRVPSIFLLPTSNIYNEREKYFDEKAFKLVSSETWLIFDDWDSVANIETNCDLEIKLEKTIDMNLFGDMFIKCFSSNNIEDPYGEIDSGYIQAFNNFKNDNKNYIQEFYIIKHKDKNIGIVNIIQGDNILSIYSFAIIEEYRKIGVGKKALKQILSMYKQLKNEFVFLQTENGFYPEKLYKKMGFKDICIGYTYVERPKQ